MGLVGSCVVASRLGRHSFVGTDMAQAPSGARGTVVVHQPTGSLVRDYGLMIRPWPDIPLGIVVGVASQYLLVPVMEAPLLPFVHNLYGRLGSPAKTLTSGVYGPGLVVLALLVCVGSPFVEELFFRGLLLRALVGRLRGLGSKLCPALSIVLTGLLFALAHFEALQFLGLAGFGIVLGWLAWRTGRLGPSIVAHMAFNAVTVISIAVSR